MESIKTVLITGAAGFIGSSLTVRLLKGSSDIRIVGLDNLNPYYDVDLKHYRLRLIEKTVREYPGTSWTFLEGDVSDRTTVERVFAEYKPDIVIHLAAQAGVRYSITHPDAYLESNLIGFFRIMEACRASQQKNGTLKHFFFASSSSVYGLNDKELYSEEDRTDQPVSLYAATKKSDEVLAYSYAKLYGIPTTGLRFFTVYGPAGRPDMAYYSFTQKLLAGEKIRLFNYGNCQRDFTYIDDVTEGLFRMIAAVMDGKTSKDGVAYRIYNIGNNHPEKLTDFVQILYDELVLAGLLSQSTSLLDCLELLPMQPGDVVSTYADPSRLERDYGFKPKTSLREGLRRFVKWYQ